MLGKATCNRDGKAMLDKASYGKNVEATLGEATHKKHGKSMLDKAAHYKDDEATLDG